MLNTRHLSQRGGDVFWVFSAGCALPVARGGRYFPREQASPQSRLSKSKMCSFHCAVKYKGSRRAKRPEDLLGRWLPPETGILGI